MRQREWDGRCHRCRKEATCHTMSKFNTQLVCMECLEKEQAHPAYAKASEAEERAVRSGDRNFQGIGKPADL